VQLLSFFHPLYLVRRLWGGRCILLLYIFHLRLLPPGPFPAFGGHEGCPITSSDRKAAKYAQGEQPRQQSTAWEEHCPAAREMQ